MSEFSVTAMNCIEYSLEIPIEASADRVWMGLLHQINAWWLSDFRMLGPTSVISLEGYAGGRLFEENRDQSLLWYSVIMINPPQLLSLAGHMTPEFGGPVTSLLTFNIESRGMVTTLRFSDSLMGKVSPGQAESLRNGWSQLLTDGLKRWAESAEDAVELTG
jgi:hypothetical protein